MKMKTETPLSPSPFPARKRGERGDLLGYTGVFILLFCLMFASVNLHSTYAQSTGTPQPVSPDQNYDAQGAAFYNSGDYDKAIDAYSEAIALNGEDQTAYYNRCLAYYQKSQLDNALADCTTAIRLSPTDTDSYIGRGLIYMVQNNYDKALADDTQAIKLDTTNAVPYNNRGRVYYAMNENDKAIADFNKAIELDSQFADAYYARGVLYAAQGDRTKAVQDFQQVLKIDPNYAYGPRIQDYLNQKFPFWIPALVVLALGIFVVVMRRANAAWQRSRRR